MSRLIVSISGIRGIVGDALGPRQALRFALAFGTRLEGGTVVLGRDSRPSGPMLAAALEAGLLATGCDVRRAGILSTPGVSVLLGHLGAAGGAVITASHNPSPYNGIKLLSSRGVALTAEEGGRVREIMDREDFHEMGTEGVGAVETVTDAAEVHVGRVLETVPETDADAIRAAGFHVVVDATNGAGGAEMRLLAERLGCTVTAINEEPTGDFGRPPEPTPANLSDLGEKVRKVGADIGLALDPDADRLSLVDAKGRAIGEEYTLALSARHRLGQEVGDLAANLSTSRMIDRVAEEAGVKVLRTPVGEVNVATTIVETGCLIGGEGNGGVIDPRVTLVRDSLAGAALVLGLMARREVPLADLADELPHYEMVKDKVPLEGTDAGSVLEKVRDLIDGAEIDERDGVHLSTGAGWLHVRASNTEPILRVLAEADDEATARRWVDEVKQLASQ